MSERVVPLGWSILVRRKAPSDTTEGGIVLPEMVKEAEHAAETRGVIVAVGPDAWSDMKEMKCSPGDHIIFKKYGGVGVSTEKYCDVLVNDRDVLAKVEFEDE